MTLVRPRLGDSKRSAPSVSTDPFAGAKRSQIMSRIRGKNTAPERALAAKLKCLGIRFRRNDRRLVGCPDFTFHVERVAAFLDGDFWHGRPLRLGRGLPSTNREFWTEKLRRNAARDRRVGRLLRSQGWRVLRIWTSDFRRDPERALRRIVRALGSPT